MKELRFALKNTFPIMLTYVFLGIAFGMMMNDAGFSVGLAALTSIFVYAGSLQIAMVPLMAAGTPLWSLALMSFFINARHIFYGIALIDRYRKMGWRFPYMVFGLTDETYSVLCSVKFEDGVDEKNASFLITLLDQSYWVLGSVLGACAGKYLPVDLSGIEFAGTAFFLVVVVNQWMQYKTKAPFLTAVLCAAVFYALLGPDYFLIPALLTALIALLLLRPMQEKHTLQEEKEAADHV